MSLSSLQTSCQSESSLPRCPPRTYHTEVFPHINRKGLSQNLRLKPPLAPLLPVQKNQEVIAEEKSQVFSQNFLNENCQAVQYDRFLMPTPNLPRQIQPQIFSAPAPQDQTSSATPISTFSDWGSVPSVTPWLVAHPSFEHAQFDSSFVAIQKETSTRSNHTFTCNHNYRPIQSFSLETDWV